MKDAIVSGYRHTGIVVKDMPASIHFYRDILGLKVVQDFNDSSEYINFITGLENADVHMVKLEAEDGTILEILEYRNHATELIDHPIHKAGTCHIAFRTPNAQEAHKRLKAEGCQVMSEPMLSSEKIAKVFFCLDPNGVRIEMVEMIE